MTEHESPAQTEEVVQETVTTEAASDAKPLTFNELLAKKNRLQRSIDAATATATRAYENLQGLKEEHNKIVDAITQVVSSEKYV